MLIMNLGTLSLMLAGNLYLFFTPFEISPIIKYTQAERLPPNVIETLTARDNKALLLVQSQTRPLFSPNRRPWVAAAMELVPEPIPTIAQPLAIEPIAPVDVQPPDVVLIGIQKNLNSAKALLLKTGTADAVWFKLGQQIDEWTIGSIENETVELANGHQRIKLELYSNSTPPPARTQPVDP
jgi:hypothetical protein